MNKHGFTLIELMLGFGIGALMLMMLFQNFSMINKVVRRADNFVEIDFASAIIRNQLQNDLSGAFVPATPPKTDAQDESKTGPTKTANATDKQDEPFAAATKDGRFYSLTFITSNPLRVYPYEKDAVIKPRIVRVEYTLEPQKEKNKEKNTEKLFTLIRKESDNLSYKNFKDIRGYEVARNIQSAGLSLMYPKKSEKPDEKPERKKVDKWPLKEDPKEKTPPMPERVEIEISLTTAARQKVQKYNFGFDLYGFNGVSMVTTSTAPVISPGNAGQTPQKPGEKPASQVPNGKLTALNGKPSDNAKSGISQRNDGLTAGFETLIHTPAQPGNPSTTIAHFDTNFDMNEIENILKELKQHNSNVTYNKAIR